MAAESYRRLQDGDVRVLDYLDDKLQSLTDFETLDSLLDSVKSQQDLLKQQVRRPTMPAYYPVNILAAHCCSTGP